MALAEKKTDRDLFSFRDYGLFHKPQSAEAFLGFDQGKHRDCGDPEGVNHNQHYVVYSINHIMLIVALA